MRKSRNFRRGGGGLRQSGKKALTTLGFFLVCFAFFLVLSLFYRSQMVNFKEKNSFFKVPDGVQIFPVGKGGATFSTGGGGGGGGGGSKLLIPYRNPFNL